VTRGTRPKKPSSSRGFVRAARGARGTRGSWGLKTGNQNIFSPLFLRQQQQFFFIFLFFYFFCDPTGAGLGALRAIRGARRDGCQTGCPIGPDEVPDGGQMEGLTGGQTGQMGCPTGLDEVPDWSHVIGHVIFVCHVTCLGWHGVILLPILLSER
jgi:hypothetical protein